MDTTEPVTILGTTFTLPTELPFTWQIFYFSAIFVAIGSTLYSLLCPPIVRDFRDYDEFKSRGYGTNYFSEKGLEKKYGRRKLGHISPHKVKERFSIINTHDQPYEDYYHYLGILFHDLHKEENMAKIPWRFICSACYLFGLFLMGIVFIQNFLYVFCRFVGIWECDLP
jgi:hypothetical protein